MSLTSVDLPDPDTPVTAMKRAERERHVDVAQVVLAGALDHQLPARDRAAAGAAGTGISRRPDRYAPVSESLAGQQVVDRAGHHDLAAVLAGARADVDHPVGDLDRVLVVLDDDQRVADVAQPEQRLDQPAVVPLVQPDRRLVQHVEHADQAGADLGGQPDPLRLAAGQRRRRPVQRQVVQPDVDQEAEPGVDLLEHPLGDHPLPLGQLQPAQELARLADRTARTPRRSTCRRA